MSGLERRGNVSGKKLRLRSVCAVSTCRSPQEMSFHRLPRDPKLRELWMKACGRKNPVTANARICGLHFRPQDFVRDLRSELMGCRLIRRLQPYAYPTVHLPDDIKMEMQGENDPIHMPYDISNIHNYAEMATGIKSLHQQLTQENGAFRMCYSNEKQPSLLTFPLKDTSEVQEEEDHENNQDSKEESLEETIIHITPETESSPLMVGVSNVPYDKSEITKALVLKSISTEAFNVLCHRGILHNPSEAYQKKWMKSFRTHQGVQVDTLDILEERILAYNAPEDRLCILAMEEVPVREGSVETVTLGFARGLCKTWKQAVYFNESKTDHQEIRILIRELEKRGLKVLALTFPPESIYNCMSGFDFDSNNYSMPNPHDSERTIFAVPDSSRILGLIRDEILKREISFNNKTLSIKDFQKILNGSKHLEDEGSILLAAELLSSYSAKALLNAGKKKQSLLVKALSDWFDVMNASEEELLSLDDPLSLEPLATLLKLLPKISFVNSESKPGPKSSKPVSISLSLVMCIQATEALIGLLRSQFKVSSLSTRRLSCEFIKDFLGGSNFIMSPGHTSVFHRFRSLQLLGPDKTSRDRDFIPTCQVFHSLDIEINTIPYLEKNCLSEEESEEVEHDDFIFK